MDEDSRIELAQLKLHIRSSDPLIAKRAGNDLCKLGGEEVTLFLISLLYLDNSESETRNLAAISLMNIADPIAIEHLYNAALKPENLNYTGSICWALSHFDCKNYLKET